MIHCLSLFLLLVSLPAVCSQYYNPSLYQSYMGASGIPRQQTILVPVYTQGSVYGGGMGGYPGGYGVPYASYPGYGMYAGGYPMMSGSACCGAEGVGMMPARESNAKKFLRGATEGVFMGSIGMLGFRR